MVREAERRCYLITKSAWSMSLPQPLFFRTPPFPTTEHFFRGSCRGVSWQPKKQHSLYNQDTETTAIRIQSCHAHTSQPERPSKAHVHLQSCAHVALLINWNNRLSNISTSQAWTHWRIQPCSPSPCTLHDCRHRDTCWSSTSSDIKDITQEFVPFLLQ